MPKTLNASNTFSQSISGFPLAGNNEPVAIGPLENAIQTVLNNSYQAKLRLDDLEAGVKNIRRLPSLTALMNLVGTTTGEVVLVDNYGLYIYDGAWASSTNPPWVVGITGQPSSKVWRHALYSLRASAGGLATLDTNWRLLQDVRDASILTQHLADASVTTPKLADASVTTAKLVNGSVTGSKLAVGAALANLGYTPANQAGDTFSGGIVAGAGVAVTGTYGGTWTTAGWGKGVQIPKSFTLFWPKGTGTYAVGIGSPFGSSEIQFIASGGDNNVYTSQVFLISNLTALTPGFDNGTLLGAATYRWSAVYAANGTIQTSDAREKTDIQPTPLGLEFIQALKPVAYRWKEGGKVPVEREVVEVGEDGQEITRTEIVYESRPGRRLHHGLIAQEVRTVLDRLGVEDFGGWVLTDPDDPESTQALRYDQFIAPLVRAVQELAARVEALEAR